jgi:transcriptional regulator NrdR family protein
MKCSSCQAETKVLESRLTEDNYMRRRRECTECGFRVTTWESTQAPTLRDRAAYERERRAKLPPEKRNARKPETLQRKRLREMARKEAFKTGESVGALYARWGVS